MDEEAMAELLIAGRFRAGLDVYTSEPLPTNSLLMSVPESQLVMSPHIGHVCKEVLVLRQDVTVTNILAFLADSPQNVVSS